jgi:hypothetical protein
LDILELARLFRFVVISSLILSGSGYFNASSNSKSTGGSLLNLLLFIKKVDRVSFELEPDGANEERYLGLLESD